MCHAIPHQSERSKETNAKSGPRRQPKRRLFAWLHAPHHCQGTGGEPPLRSGESLLVSHLASVSPSHLASHPRILPLTLASCLSVTLASCLSLTLASCLSPSHLASVSPSHLASHPRILPLTLASCLSVTLASCLSLTLAFCPGEMVVTMSWTRAHPHHLTAGTCSRPPGRTAPLPSGSGHDGPSG